MSQPDSIKEESCHESRYEDNATPVKEETFFGIPLPRPTMDEVNKMVERYLSDIIFEEK